MRKHKRSWTSYFSQFSVSCESPSISLLDRVIRTIQQLKVLSVVTGLSIIVLLANFLLVPAQSRTITIEKSPILSQPTCVSCTYSNDSPSSNSGYKGQEPFVIPPIPVLSRNTPTTSTQTSLPAQGELNLFPYGSCTWWANQRYFQLHGIFVPWQIQSNAWQWTTRAYQYGWDVSSSPVVGASIDLQPGVQGASWLGHVAVVESILSNGDVIASNMNWGKYPWQVTYVEFAPGPGVTFLYLLNSTFQFRPGSNMK